MNAKLNRRGLTLVEMLVAMALTLALLALCTTIFVSASSSVNAIRGITEVDHKVRSAVGLIRNDLEHVYLRDDKGRPITPAQLFNKNHGPAAEGYFTIEENWPAMPMVLNQLTVANAAQLANRQGIDSAGVPVEIDTDDVLGLTVRYVGVTPDTVFRGRCPPGVSGENPLGFDQVVASRSSFDDRFDGTFTSPMAEVVYFLRPNNKQHLQTDINSPGSQPVLPATYTLYRRQLLVLADEIVTAIESETSTAASAPLSQINAGRFYDRFDLSARYDPASAKLRPNTMKNLSLRRNRYGMVLNQTAGGSPLIRELPFVASSFANGLHHPRLAATDNVWFGRPTLKESAHPQYPMSLPNANAAKPLAYGLTAFPNMVWADTQNDATATAATNGDGNMDTYSASAGQRSGEDILLTNVVSFDIKVLDDDYVLGTGALTPPPPVPPNTVQTPVNPLDWPGYLTVAANTPRRTRAVNPNADPAYPDNTTPYADGAGAERPEFIDLGFIQYKDTGPGQFFFDNPATGPLPFNYDPNTLIVWGLQNVARWRSVGRNDPDQFANRLEPVATYDSWSTQYQLNPSNPALPTDDIRRPPYERPLRAIQINLRVLEPKTNIVREFAIVHRFPD